VPLVRARPIVSALVLAIAIRAAWLFVAYATGSDGTQRHHVEAGVLLLVIAGVAARLALPRRADSQSWPVPAFAVSLGAAAWAAFAAFAFVLYWPALTLGLLSDDVLLAARARAFQVGQMNDAFFRPVPLLAWAPFLGLPHAPIWLHAINVLLHGTNAWLAARVLLAWTPNSNWAAAAGIVVLTAPLGVEPVAWLSGVFDLSWTAFALGAVLAARRYAIHPSPAVRAALYALVLGGMLSKETGVVIPALVLVDALATRRGGRFLWFDLAVLAGMAAIGSTVRVTGADWYGDTPLRYALQRGFFGVFGALAVPWHEDVGHSIPLLRLASGLIALGWLTAFLLRPAPAAGTARMAAASIVWILIAIVPVFPFFDVAPDLQGSRYAYASSVGWAALAVVVLSGLARLSSWTRLAAGASLAAVVAGGVLGVRLHLRPWQDAALTREAVRRALAAQHARTGCERLVVGGLQDTIKGAYLFRVGARETLGEAVPVPVEIGSEPGPCSFVWDAQSRRLAATSRPASANESAVGP
jgi:hypothetical protein